jgi:hypothetical protein
MAHRWPPRTPKEVAESIFVILGADKAKKVARALDKAVT